MFEPADTPADRRADPAGGRRGRAVHRLRWVNLPFISLRSLSRPRNNFIKWEGFSRDDFVNPFTNVSYSILIALNIERSNEKLLQVFT